MQLLFVANEIVIMYVFRSIFESLESGQMPIDGSPPPFAKLFRDVVPGECPNLVATLASVSSDPKSVSPKQWDDNQRNDLVNRIRR